MQLDLSSTDYWAEIFTTKNYLGEKSMQAVKEKKKDRIKKGGAAGQNGKQGRMQCGLLWTCLIPTTPSPSLPVFFSFFTTPSPLPRALVPFSPPHVHRSACLLQQQESGRAMPLTSHANCPSAERESPPSFPAERDFC